MNHHMRARGRGVGRPQYGGRSSPKEEEKKERSLGIIHELPILTWIGSRSNYPDFKENMSTYLQQKFGNNGIFIAQDEYYEPVEPEEPMANDADNAPRRDKVLWSVWESEMKARTKLMNKHLEERTQMYQVIWGQLSNESKEIIRKNQMFDEAELDTNGRPDPLVLWRIIASTHLIKSTGSLPMDRRNAKKNYERLKQNQTESLGDFKLRFDRAIEALEQIEHPQIPDIPDRVLHFIEALSDAKHHEWKT